MGPPCTAPLPPPSRPPSPHYSPPPRPPLLSLSSPFLLLTLPSFPPSLPCPFLALPLPLSFTSLLILIAYALPCLSYLPPSSLTCSFHIWRSVRPCLVVVLEHPTWSWPCEGFQMAKGAECRPLYPSMFHMSCTKLYIIYGEGMLGYCPILSSI